MEIGAFCAVHTQAIELLKKLVDTEFNARALVFDDACAEGLRLGVGFENEHGLRNGHDNPNGARACVQIRLRSGEELLERLALRENLNRQQRRLKHRSFRALPIDRLLRIDAYIRHKRLAAQFNVKLGQNFKVFLESRKEVYEALLKNAMLQTWHGLPPFQFVLRNRQRFHRWRS